MVPAYMTASLLQAKTADASLPRLHIQHRKDRCKATRFKKVGTSLGGKHFNYFASYFCLT